MLISDKTLNNLLGFLQDGTYTANKFATGIIYNCLRSLKTILFDSIADVLPVALTVAGAILVVNLGWRLFRNFTKG